MMYMFFDFTEVLSEIEGRHVSPCVVCAGCFFCGLTRGIFEVMQGMKCVGRAEDRDSFVLHVFFF